MEDWRSRQGLSAALPRQPAPLPATQGPAEQLAGTSSFGMSGVNAHLLLAHDLDAHAGAASDSQLLWERKHHWPALAPHPLLLQCSMPSSSNGGVAASVVFSCNVGLARLAFLQNHVAGGTPTLPITSLLELLLAAAAAALSGTSDGRALQPSLAGVAAGAPLQLPAGGDVLCTLYRGNGQAAVESSCGARHLAADIAGIWQAAAPAQPSIEATPPRALDQLLCGRLIGSRQAVPQPLLGHLDRGNADSCTGWLLHPAAADAALVHLAAACGGSPPSIASTEAISAVSAATSAVSWCCSLPAALQGSPMMLSARAHPAGGSDLSAEGLCLRPLTTAPPAGAAGSSTKAASATGLSYQIQWQATESLPGRVFHQRVFGQVAASGAGLRVSLAASVAAGAAGGLVAGMTAATGVSIMPAAGSSASSAAVAAGGIELLQRVLAVPGSGPAVQVQGCIVAAPAASPSGRLVHSSSTSSTSSAMLAALMRVAAVEQPDRRWASMLIDSQRPPDLGPSSAEECGADQHGVQLGAGLLSHPRMLRHAAPAQQGGSVHGGPTECTAAGAGRWLISGGTGALGALSASWVTAAGTRHVQLLGRTGRSSAASLAAEGSEPAAVTLQMCDAATASDAAAVLGCASPLAGVLHAGGLLSDATLPNQTLAGRIR